MGDPDVVGDTSNTTSQLICDIGLGVNNPLDAGINKFSLQNHAFLFKSDHGEKDINDTLNDIFPDDVTSIAVSRVRIRPLDADHL